MFRPYLSPPFDIDSLIDESDYFVGDGFTTTFTLTKKTGFRVGETAQVGSTFLSRGLNEFAVSGDDVVFATAPSAGAVITIPGQTRLQVKAFDQLTVIGHVTPNVGEVSFYVVDPTDIHWLKHYNAPSLAGIRVSVVDHDATFGAEVDWFQLARSIGSGGPGVYEAAGDPLYLPDIEEQDTVQSPTLITATSITVADGSQFQSGDVLVINKGNPTEDTCVIESILGNVLTITALQEAHAAAEIIYKIGYKCWLKMIVPENVAGNSALNLYEMAIACYGISENRL